MIRRAQAWYWNLPDTPQTIVGIITIFSLYMGGLALLVLTCRAF